MFLLYTIMQKQPTLLVPKAIGRSLPLSYRQSIPFPYIGSICLSIPDVPSERERPMLLNPNQGSPGFQDHSPITPIRTKCGLSPVHLSIQFTWTSQTKSRHSPSSWHRHQSINPLTRYTIWGRNLWSWIWSGTLQALRAAHQCPSSPSSGRAITLLTCPLIPKWYRCTNYSNLYMIFPCIEALALLSLRQFTVSKLRWPNQVMSWHFFFVLREPHLFRKITC